MKTTFNFLIAILGLALFSCSKNPAEPTLDEIISGAYQMSMNFHGRITGVKRSF